MVLQRWDPFVEMKRVDDALNRMWGGSRPSGYDVERWNIPMDVVQNGDDITVRASIPGVNPDEISVTLEDGLLTIEAETKSETETHEPEYLLRERRYGRFHRSLRLPDTVDADRAEPSYDNGVLSITVPKQETKKARRLEIKTG